MRGRTCRARAEEDPQRPVEVEPVPLDLAVGRAPELLRGAVGDERVPVRPARIPFFGGGNLERMADDDDLGVQCRLFGEPGQEGPELREVGVDLRIVAARRKRSAGTVGP